MLAKLRNLVVRLLYPYGSTRRIYRGYLKGYRFIVASSMGFTYAWGWDVYGWGFLAGKLSARNVVFDLGANRGQMSLFFSLLVGANGEVVSFEPMNAMIDIARRNAESNKCSNISFHNFAIAEKMAT